MPVKIFCRKNSALRGRGLKRPMEALLRYAGGRGCFLEISLVGNKTMGRLNRKYLKSRGLTDVLSFPLEDPSRGPGVPRHLGEIVVATEVARRQAKRAKRSLTQQVVRLSVHGFVHLEGFDHARGRSEKKRFEDRERRLLGFLQRKGLLKWDGSLLF